MPCTTRKPVKDLSPNAAGGLCVLRDKTSELLNNRDAKT
jgi:hypothetical protein